MWRAIWCGYLGLFLLTGGSRSSTAAERVQSGIYALYDFGAIDGAVVRDSAGRARGLDLRIADVQAVRHSAAGLEVVGPTLIQSEKPAAELVEAIRGSPGVTLEVWIRPADVRQTGPARIVTLSRNPSERNFTLGQDGERVEVRFRSTETSTNGMPALASKANSLGSDWTHIAYTRDRAGLARLYLNGTLNAEQKVGGSTSNWDAGFHLAIANELSRDRPWRGTYRLVAVYLRALTAAEVEQNFQAGVTAAAVSQAPAPFVSEQANKRRFETVVAPLLSRHCLECHDTLTRRGGLDLSRRAAALAGGTSGAAIVAGRSSESRLWQRVEADEMPQDRPPLTAAEKQFLKQWLDAGAAWTLDVIDPAVYVQGPGSQAVYVQRLTVPEYIESVRATLGVDIAEEARRLLPRDQRADGFSNTAYNLNVDLGHVEAYARLAEIIAERTDVKALAARHTNSRELTDENVTKVVEAVGRRLLRGPLTAQEIAVYCGISTTVAGAGGNFEEAVRCILEAMLQSPRFLYRIEQQRGDGSPLPAGPYELASRLSYMLWGGPPDDTLLAAAEKGALDRAGVESQALRMLQDRRAVERSRQFLTEWLNLDRLDNLRPNPQRFPQWDARLAADMRNETLAFFEEVVWKQNRPLAELLNAQVTFVTPRLAAHYGLPLNAAPAGDAAVRYDLSSVPGRGGLLTQGSVLTVGGDDASMVSRGLFVLHELLRGVVRDPPPCVDTTPIQSKPGLTQRAVAESRIANKNCAGCHAKFEPLAFGLEKFDGLGTLHEKDEYGNLLREDGSVLFPGQEQPVPYKSTGELMDLLAQSERVRESLTWKIAQFALGRPLGAEDAAVLGQIHRAAEQAGGTYASVMTAIVTSDLVLMGRRESGSQ